MALTIFSPGCRGRAAAPRSIHCLLLLVLLGGYALPRVSGEVSIVAGHMTVELDQDSSLNGDQQQLQLVAPRGGQATAVVLVHNSSGAVGPVQARLQTLRHQQAARQDLAAAVRVWYGSQRVDLGPSGDGASDGQSPYFDALAPEPVDETPLQPIYLQIRVPADAQPGLYQGEVEVAAQGGQSRIPIELAVSSFVVPPVEERQGWVDMIQSPDSVAYRYGVPLYSPQHFQLLRPSMEKLAAVGQQTMMVSAISHTNFGNDEAMIPIGPQGVDFSGFEGYLQLFQETVGQPRLVIVYAVEGSRDPRWTPPGGARDGTAEYQEGSYGPEHRAQWQALMDGIRERVVAAGWDESSIVLGWIGDRRPFDPFLELFTEVAPYARWVQFTHARGDPNPSDGRLEMLGMEVAYRILPYAAQNRRGPVAREEWQQRFIQTTSGRQTNDMYYSMRNWRSQPVEATLGRSRGFDYVGVSRIGLDFWPVQRPDGSSGRLLKRHARWHNLQRDTAAALTVAGPQGALPTVRWLNFVQGAEENEARLLIGQALAGDALPQGVSAEQAEEILKAFFEVREMQRRDDPSPSPPENEAEILGKLFELAGRIQENLP